MHFLPSRASRVATRVIHFQKKGRPSCDGVMKSSC